MFQQACTRRVKAGSLVESFITMTKESPKDF